MNVFFFSCWGCVCADLSVLWWSDSTVPLLMNDMTSNQQRVPCVIRHWTDRSAETSKQTGSSSAATIQGAINKRAARQLLWQRHWHQRCFTIWEMWTKYLYHSLWSQGMLVRSFNLRFLIQAQPGNLNLHDCALWDRSESEPKQC